MTATSDQVGRIEERRLPRPEEIVSALLVVASDESSDVTGVCLDVNGSSFMA